MARDMRQPVRKAPEAKPVLILVSILSSLTSFAFIYYGLNFLTANQGAPQGALIFPYIVAGYGLGNIYLLSSAWRKAGDWPASASKLMGLCFLAVFTMETVNSGIESSVELVGIFGVVLVLWANWFSISKVARRDDL